MFITGCQSHKCPLGLMDMGWAGTHTSTHMQAHTSTYICMSTHKHAHTYTCTRTRTHTHTIYKMKIWRGVNFGGLVN